MGPSYGALPGSAPFRRRPWLHSPARDAVSDAPQRGEAAWLARAWQRGGGGLLQVIEPSLSMSRADAEPVALHTAEMPRSPGFERDTRAELVSRNLVIGPRSHYRILGKKELRIVQAVLPYCKRQLIITV